jgi:hypothetical protein
MLKILKAFVQANDYVIVGNDGTGQSSQPGHSMSDEKGLAAATGWRYIKESDFANGAR